MKVVLGDFAENHPFIVQDATEGLIWNSHQASIHPFMWYFKKYKLQQGNYYTSTVLLSLAA
jgi:hypothetical protein